MSVLPDLTDTDRIHVDRTTGWVTYRGDRVLFPEGLPLRLLELLALHPFGYRFPHRQLLDHLWLHSVVGPGVIKTHLSTIGGIFRGARGHFTELADRLISRQGMVQFVPSQETSGDEVGA
jgi:hypothetical protein